MLLIKLTGIILILGGFGLGGLEQAGVKRRRVESLKQLGLMLSTLAQEIIYRQTPLSLALQQAAGTGKIGAEPLLSAWGEKLAYPSGMTAAEAFRQVQAFWPSELQEPERHILAAIAEQIGTSPAAEQKKLFAYGEERLRQLEDAASLDQEKNGRLWTYGGFLAGAALVLLLI
jgi:stage III sporulation protein AB